MELESEHAHLAADQSKTAQGSRLQLLQLSSFTESSEIGGLVRLYFKAVDTLKSTMENTELRVSDRVIILIVADLWDAATETSARGGVSGLRCAQATTYFSLSGSCCNFSSAVLSLLSLCC
jgi:hypothetical protein